jgi:RNA polymerase sigma-70 factor (ECF subfamily)
MDDLVERARAGDRAAVERLLGEIAPRVRRFGERLCGNAHDADDVLQDTLMSVVQNLDQYAGHASFSTWVFALARSACARRRRGLKNRPPVSDERVAEQSDHAPGPEREAADREAIHQVVEALDRLPPESREAILLRDVEALSALETASVLGVSVDALKSRLHRARAALRRELGPSFEPSAPEAKAGCPDVLALWSKKLEADLSQRDCAAMEAHVASCEACRRACDALKRALSACQQVSSDPVPERIQRQITAAVGAATASLARSS